MRVKDIARRIGRIIELEGAVSCVADFAEAVAMRAKALSDCADGIVDAVAAGQYGDAMARLSEMPDLLAEVAVLREDGLMERWRAFCGAHGLPFSALPEQGALDKIAEFQKAPGIADAAQKSYRRGIRTKDSGLTVLSLRLLADNDTSRDWRGDLARAEEVWKRELGAGMDAADARGEADMACEAAEKLLGGKWQEPPPAEITDKARRILSSAETDAVAREQGEALDLLRLCGENWDAAKAGRIIAYLDRLSGDGVRVPDEDAEMVAAARAHCEADAKAAEFDKAWRAASERLFIAVGHESPDEIRAAMAAVEFQDRPPEEDVYRRARLVIMDADARRRRKLVLAASCVVLAVAAVVAVSASWLANRNFNARCDEEARNLELLSERGNANAIEEILGKIRESAPRVFNDPRVRKYAERLGELKEEQGAILIQAGDAVAALESINAAGFGSVEEKDLASKVNTAGELLGKLTYKGLAEKKAQVAERFARVKAVYDEYAAGRLAERVAEAEKAFPPLLARMRELGEKLSRELYEGDLVKAAETCEGEVASWMERYSTSAPELAAQIEGADFSIAKKKSADAAALMSKFLACTSASDALRCRSDLKEFYGAFTAVGEMPDMLGYDESDVDALLEGGPANSSTLMEYASSMTGDPDEAMLKRVRESMSKSYDLLGEAYYVWRVNETNCAHFAIGEHRLAKDVSGYVVRGDILTWNKAARAAGVIDSIKDGPNAPIAIEPLPSTEDLRDLSMAASDAAATAHALGNAIARKIGAICANARAADFIKRQRDFSWKKGAGLSAYRMTQMLNVYLNWLRKLCILPESEGMKQVMSDCRALALPVPVRYDASTSGNQKERERKSGLVERFCWLFQQDDPVRKRNAECADFLLRMASEGLDARISTAPVVGAGLKVAAMNGVRFAGVLSFVRGSSRKVVSPECGEDAVPLYALRKRAGGRLVLVPALVPKDGSWVPVAQSEGDDPLAPGDLLFAFTAGGKMVNQEEELRRILADAPAVTKKEAVWAFRCK